MKNIMLFMSAMIALALFAGTALADTTYQEDADAFFGVLTFNLTACDDWTDGNYSTPCNDGSGNQNNYAYMNYTIPEGAVSATWNVDGSKTVINEPTHNWFNYSASNDCFDYAVDNKLRLIYYTFGEYADGGCDYVLSCIGDNETSPEIMYEAYDTGGVFCGMWDEHILWETAEDESGMDPLTASVAGLSVLILGIGLLLAVIRGFMNNFSYETAVGVVIVSLIVIAGITIILGVL